MSRNTEATDDVKTWTGGPLNYKEGFFTQLATDELAKDKRRGGARNFGEA